MQDLSLLSSRFISPTVDSLFLYGYIFREVQEELLSHYEKDEGLEGTWETLFEFLSMFFAPSVVHAVLLNFLEMKDSSLGQEYFLRGVVAMLALRTLNDITEEFGKLAPKYVGVPVQAQDWTVVTRSRSNQDSSGGGSSTQGGGGSSLQASDRGGMRRGGRREKGNEYGGGGYIAEDIAFLEVSVVEIVLHASNTPNKHILSPSVVTQTIGERSDLYNTKVHEYLQNTPSVGSYVPELVQDGFVFLFHGMRQSSWSSFRRFGIRPRNVPNEFSMRGAFYLTNSVRHAFEHPLHQHPRRNTTDVILVLVFIVPVLVLHGETDAPGGSGPFQIKWFEHANAEWKDFCHNNLVVRRLPNHSYDFVIGPTCMPTSVGGVRNLQIDGFAPTQIACCTDRAREWIASTASTIYVEKHQ